MESIPLSFRPDSRSLCEGPQMTAVLLLIPSCLVLLVLDLAFRHSQSKQLSSTEGAPSEVDYQKLQLSAEQVSTDLRLLEQEHHAVQSRNGALTLELAGYKSLPSHLKEEAPLPLVIESAPPSPSSRRRRTSRRGVSPEFHAFCKELLDANRIWAREKELQLLKGQLQSVTDFQRAACFKNLCERILLTNEIWAKTKEVDQLREEQARAKRARVDTITRTARQTVLDMQRERMIEGFVRDVIEENAESRRLLDEARAQHEQELREMTEEWRKENRMLKREIERLRMARDAKALEQEIANELEDRLFERLREPEGDPTAESIFNEVPLVDALGDGSDDDDASTYWEEMSTSSTCVGSPVPSPMKKPIRRSSFSPPPLSESPRRKLDDIGYIGFSFNPQFFGNRGTRAPSTKGPHMCIGERPRTASPSAKSVRFSISTDSQSSGSSRRSSLGSVRSGWRP